MKKEDHIEEFKKLAIQAERLLSEFQELSKKKPDGAVNTFKLTFVNNVLRKANEILDSKNKPFEEFDEFEEEALPTNSDVVVILSQYRACLQKFFYETKKYLPNYGGHVWIIRGKPSNISAPDRYKDML